MTVPSDFYPTVDIEALKKEYVGQKLSEVPTPAFIVNRKIVEQNCEAMLTRARQIKADFRAHVKTHKTVEGVAYQLGKDRQCKRIVVSTLMEAWKCKKFFESGEIDDVLYGIPPAKSRIGELQELKKHVKSVRLMIDHASQLDLLRESQTDETSKTKWSIFIKVNMGTNRAGMEQGSAELKDLIQKVLSSDLVSLYGFYCHAGHSYSSSTKDQAVGYLYDEIKAANDAAILAQSINADLTKDLVISVGSTPTSHASGDIDLSKVTGLAGKLELHAGNYPFCDLQQMATNCISEDNVACKVVAEVVSLYPNRGAISPGEVLINAGVIALAREPGPVPGFGKIVGHDDEWYVGRLSQEHGIVVPKSSKAVFPKLTERVEIIPQHSCITANAYPFYFVHDGEDKVVDVWVGWRGW